MSLNAIQRLTGGIERLRLSRFIEIPAETGRSGQSRPQSAAAIADLVAGAGMHEAPVVPKDRIVDRPAMLVDVFRLSHVVRQIVEQLLALRLRHSQKAVEVHRAQENAFPSGLGM